MLKETDAIRPVAMKLQEGRPPLVEDVVRQRRWVVDQPRDLGIAKTCKINNLEGSAPKRTADVSHAYRSGCPTAFGGPRCKDLVPPLDPMHGNRRMLKEV